MRSAISEVLTATSNITVQLTPYADSAKTPAESYLSTGFTIFHDGPHSFLGIGSNFSNQESHGASRVLDGAAIKPIVDKDNVIIGYVQVTADGLGHDDDDFNNKVAQMSNSSTKYIAEKAASIASSTGSFTEENMKNVLAEAGESSYREVYGAQAFNRSNAQNSVAVTVALNINGEIKLINGNVGDLMSLIIDPVSLEVLSSVSARQFESKTPDRNVVYIPESIQSLAYEKKDRFQIESQLACSAGFYSFHLSDGVHDYLPTLPAEKNAEVNVVKLDHERISEKLRQRLSYNESTQKKFSKHEIGQALNGIATEALLGERQQKLKAQPVIKKAVASMNKALEMHVNGEIEKELGKKPHEIAQAYTIEQLMLDLEKGFKQGVYGIPQERFSLELIKAVDDFFDKNDYVNDCPAAAFIREMIEGYKEQSGDDATFSGIAVPDHRVELVRAWCEHDDSCQGLNDRIKSDLTINDVDSIFSVLADERYLPVCESGHEYFSELEKCYSYEFLLYKKTRLLLQLFDNIENLNNHIISELDDIISTLDQTSTVAKDNVIIKIKSLVEMARKKPDFETVCSLVVTRDILKNPSKEEVRDYLAYADTLKGAASVKKRVIGGIIVGIGISLGTAATVAALVFSFGAASPLVIGLAAGGFGSFLSGVGLAYSGRRKGLSKGVYNIGAQLKDNGIFPRKESLDLTESVMEKAEAITNQLSTI